MHVMAGHQPLVVLRRCNAAGVHALDEAALHQLDRLERAVGLLGEHKGGVGQFALAGGQRAITEIDEYTDGS